MFRFVVFVSFITNTFCLATWRQLPTRVSIISTQVLFWDSDSIGLLNPELNPDPQHCKVFNNGSGQATYSRDSNHRQAVLNVYKFWLSLLCCGVKHQVFFLGGGDNMLIRSVLHSNVSINWGLHQDVSTLQIPVLHLDMFPLQGPQLHLDAYTLQSFVLHQAVSTLQGSELHMDMSILQVLSFYYRLEMVHSQKVQLLNVQLQNIQSQYVQLQDVQNTKLPVTEFPITERPFQ